MKVNIFVSIFFIFTLICLVGYTVWIHNSIEFLYILIFFASFSYIYKKEARKIYLLSFASSIIFGCILIFVYQTNGSFFAGGGDDEKFFNYFVDGFNGTNILFTFRYGNYLLFGSTFISILNYFEINDVSPLLVYPLNWFYGANVCAMTYILAKQIGLDKIRAFVPASLISIYPFFVYSEVRMLREILAALLLIIFIVTYLSQIKLILKIIIFLTVAIILIGVRGEFILYMGMFVGIDVFFNLHFNNKKSKAYFLLIIAGIIGVVALGFIMQITGKADQSVSDIGNSYSELRGGNENSLGTILKNGGPLFTPLVIMYLWISPFPPPAFQIFDLIYLIISIGVIFWYYAYLKFPFLLINYLKNYKENKMLKNNVIKLLVFLFITTIIIALTSADVRHVTTFFPYIFIIFAIVSKEYPPHKIKNLNLMAGIGTFMLFLFYLSLKSI